MPQDVEKPTRFSPAWIASLIKIPQTDQRQRAKHRRCSPRYENFGEKALLEVLNSDRATEQFPVVTRDLSREAASFILARFIHPGSYVRLTLPTTDGGFRAVIGKVQRCRYLAGTPLLHEAALMFDDPIRVELFHYGARLKEVLVLDDEGLTTKLVKKLLQNCNAQVERANTTQEMIQAATSHHFDVVLVDTDLYGTSPIEDFRSVAGPSIPVLAMCAGDEDELAALKTIGSTDVLPKPFNSEQISKIIAAHLRKQLVSSLADDPDIADLLAVFIAELPDRITYLRETRRQNDEEQVLTALRQLSADARAFGFLPICESADELSRILREDGPNAEYVVAELCARCHAARSGAPQEASA